jgi:hypothetical protein
MNAPLPLLPDELDEPTIPPAESGADVLSVVVLRRGDDTLDVGTDTCPTLLRGEAEADCSTLAT